MEIFKKQISNPLPISDLSKDIQTSIKILNEFLSTKVENELIPPRILNNCRGLLVMTFVKAGFLITGRVGTGLVIARTANGWSGVSALGSGGK